VSQETPRFSTDPVKDRARHALLAKLATQATDPAAAEMARELLAGNVTPRRILGSNLYAEVLERNAASFAGWYEDLSESEKNAQAEAGNRAVSLLASEKERVVVPRDSVEDEEDFSEQDWLNG
jgi:hypothetical protein